MTTPQHIGFSAFALLALIGGCSGTEALSGCPEGERAIWIVSPQEGQVLTQEDDVVPGGVVDFEVAVQHCGFTADDEIGIYLLEPVASPYGFRWVTEDMLVYQVPFIPGEQQLQARTRDDSVQSAVITFSVVP